MDEIGIVPRKQVEVAIAVVFDVARRVLICKRKEGAVLGGYWEFPGGKCEAGERPEECAIREVREETGLRVRVLGALGRIEHEYPHGRVRLHPFLCEVAWPQTGAEVQLLEVAEARWIEAGSVMEYGFPEANAGLVKRVAEGFADLVGSVRDVGNVGKD